MAEKTVEERIKAEKRRLNKVYKPLPAADKVMASGLIERAAWMRVQLEDLEADLQENGWTEKFQQGNAPPYDRARPAGQSYNTLNANYQKIIKQLDAMLPPAPVEAKTDGFDEFVTGREEV